MAEEKQTKEGSVSEAGICATCGEMTYQIAYILPEGTAWGSVGHDCEEHRLRRMEARIEALEKYIGIAGL